MDLFCSKECQKWLGYVPDIIWTGMPDPYGWIDLDSVANTSLDGQSNGYPIGYKSTGFVF